MSRLRLLLAVAMLGTVLALPVSASAAPPAGTIQRTIAGTVAGGGTFSGTVDITRFVVRNGVLTALGTLNGTLTDADNVAHQITDVAVALPVDLLQSTASCQVLDLVLGPLTLSLLGLDVHLDTVHLNITAQSGPGNLLGNLLCAVAHLLDGGVGGALNGVAALLNRILAILG